MGAQHSTSPSDELQHHVIELSNFESCSGDCFNLALPVGDTVLAEVASDEALHHLEVVHSPLGEGQTRVIRVLPSSDKLEIELITAEVTILGLRLVQSTSICDFVALSHCWQDGTSTRTIICNGQEVKVTNNILRALEYHRNQASDQAAHLWIDALCIDQSNVKEKAQQVTMMLDIYTNARSVTVWTGPWDDLLTIQCLRNHEDLLAQLKQLQEIEHTRHCVERMQNLHDKLLQLYERPYLSRTWVRQELFAAKDIVVVCGEEKLDWISYMSGKDLLPALLKFVNRELTAESRSQAVVALLKEADENSHSRDYSAQPVPRDIFSLTHSIRSFGASIENDSVYAILRMGGLQPVVAPMLSDATKQTFLVDYGISRSSAQVYHDLTLHLITNMLQNQTDLRKLWHYYAGRGARDAGVPSWIVDWRESVCEPSEFALVEKHFMVRPDHEGASVDRKAWSLYASYMSSARLSDARSLKLDAMKPAGRECLDIISSPMPKLLDSNKRILELPARVINYVAHVTDFTCDLGTFLALTHGNDIILSEVARTIHLHPDSGPEETPELFTVPPELHFERYNPEKHHRKVAILGCSLDEQLALVPAATKKGDIVIGLGEVLPMVITPMHDNRYKSRLYREHDPYTDHGPVWPSKVRHTDPSDRWYYSPFLVGPYAKWGRPYSQFHVHFMFWTIMASLCMTGIGVLAFVTTVKIVLLAFVVGVLLLAATIVDCIIWTRLPSVYLPTMTSVIKLIKRNHDVLDSVSDHNKNFRFIGPLFVSQWGGVRLLEAQPPKGLGSASIAGRPCQTFHVH